MNVDVTKAACALVDKAITYVDCRKYNICCSLTDLHSYLSYYVASKSSCESDLGKCDLLPYEEQSCESVASESPCIDSVDVSIVGSSSECVYTSTLLNPVSFSNRPQVILTNNSLDHQATLIHRVTSKCLTSPVDTQLYSFNVPTGMRTGPWVRVVSTANAHPNGYIKTMRLAYVDGVSPIQYIDVDISPSNTTWDVCPSCTAVTTTNLVFGAADYATQLSNRLHNVTKTLFGNNTASFIVTKTTTGTTGFIEVQTLAKHNPTGKWAGIDVNDNKFVWIDNAGNTQNTFGWNNWRSTPAYFNELVEYETPCTTLSHIVSQGFTLNVNTGTSNFNHIELLPDNTLETINETFPTSTCNYITYEASWTPSITLSSSGWYNSSDTLITSSTTLTNPSAGDYYFKAVTTGGCVIEEDITVI